MNFIYFTVSFWHFVILGNMLFLIFVPVPLYRASTY